MSHGLMCLNCQKYIVESEHGCDCVNPIPSWDGIKRADVVVMRAGNGRWKERPKGPPRRIETPWTDEQVDALNRWQTRGDVHPFTCPEHSDDALVAEWSGWRCRRFGCGYRQTWAHDFMMEYR